MAQNTCPNCGRPYRAGARFCSGCGKQISPPQPVTPPPAAALNYCTNCGKPLRSGARFCSACGAPTTYPTTGREVSPAAAPPQPAVVPPAAPPPYPPPAVDMAAGTPGVPAGEAVSPAAAPFSAGASRRYLLLHAFLVSAMLILLLFFLGGAYLLDENEEAAEPTPPTLTPITIVYTPGPPATAQPDQQQVRIGLSKDGRFGLTATGPDLGARVQGKLLTFSDIGETSNTRLWVDGEDPIFGSIHGRIISMTSRADRSGDVVWEYGKIRVTQTLEYVIGASNLGDTIRIQYRLLNTDNQSHQVGLRIMIDTLIGRNDGVPFLIPGRQGITDRATELQSSEIPDSIRALEIANLADPGVIVNLTLRGADATPPDRVVIAGWLDENMEWDFLNLAGGVGAPLRRGGKTNGEPDSAIGLFFSPQTLEAGKERVVITYYGLGYITSTATGNAKLGLFGRGEVQVGDQFYISAVVGNPQAGETVTIRLPDELKLAAGEEAVKSVQGGGEYTQISWLVQACEKGDGLIIQVELNPGGVVEEWTVNAKPTGITRPGGVCP